MTSIMTTVLKQMKYFNEYTYPAKKWSKVYPYSEVEDSKVDFLNLNTDDVYAYEQGDNYYVSLSDDDYCYSVVIRKQHVV